MSEYDPKYLNYKYWAERRIRTATVMRNAFTLQDYAVAGTDAGYCLDRTDLNYGEPYDPESR